MDKILFKNIKGLVQAGENIPNIKKGAEMKELPIIENAYLLLENGIVKEYGAMSKLDKNINNTATSIIDSTGRFVFPCFCDSHTHSVFAKTRETEFVDRINGLTYEEIALKGGGILNSAKALSEIDEDTLFENSLKRVKEIIKAGTGALEIKSGYGLSIESEIKMLRVIKRIKEHVKIPIKATLLAAHAYPKEYKENHQGYIDIIINKIIPQVKAEKLADYIDVFCERNYFSVEEMEQVLIAGKDAGLIPKVHVNQFSILGGISKAVELNALSVDHLEELGDDDILALQKSNCIATMLPGCSHFLSIPFGNARKIISNNLPLALASDFNPGSTPCFNLSTIWSLACLKMKLTPAEAFNALSVNGAYAMGLEGSHGKISMGSSPGLILSKPLDNINQIPYLYGESFVDKVIV
ncbi:MAG: imidazolonepropionase [Crocinitomicaceae bacterium]|nr:imidazolonepropionase [Crocinitomicaceae bacterium]